MAGDCSVSKSASVRYGKPTRPIGKAAPTSDRQWADRRCDCRKPPYVLALPQNSTVLADQIVAGQVRLMAMFVSAWLHALAEVQDGMPRLALLQIYRLLQVTT
jgi:hypothetical protein